MKNYALAAAAFTALTACAGVSDESDGGGTTPGVTPPAPTDIPEAIAGDLRAASLSSSGETLTVQISLDSGVVNTIYERNLDYDVDGYIAFTQQNNSLNRFFTGLAAQSSDGSVQAVVVADGGQFTKYFGGVTYQQIGRYTPSPEGPDTGLVSYAGSYAGLTNVSTRDGTADATGANPDLLPERAGRVTGEVFLNVSFAGNAVVNGAIINRQFEDETDRVLDTVFLIPTDIDANGSFSGSAENRAQQGIGSFSGTFGGVNATSVAGGGCVSGGCHGLLRRWRADIRYCAGAGRRGAGAAGASGRAGRFR